MAERSATAPAPGALRDALAAAVSVWVVTQLGGVDQELAKVAGDASAETTAVVISGISGFVVGAITFARKWLMDRFRSSS